MPLGMEVGLGPCDIVLDGNAAPPIERVTVRLCGFRHISTFGLGVGASCPSFIAIFGRPLQVTVRPVLRDHSPVCHVCNLGVMRPNGWMDQDATWCDPGDIVYIG